MCELFGLSCNEKDRATISLPIFRRRGDWCKDGWGIAYYEDNRAIIKKEPEAGGGSQKFLDTFEKAYSNIIIAHMRAATNGDVCTENCHPFAQPINGRNWIFAHNGGFGGLKQHPRSDGTTDSEQIFNLIIDYMREYQSKGLLKGAYPGIKDGVKRFLNTHKDGNLNLLMSDGALLYIFNHYQRRPIYILKREKDYGGAILVTTVRQLTDEPWTKIPEDSLVVLNRGEILVVSDPLL